MKSEPTLRDIALMLVTLRKRYEGHTGHTHPGNDQWRHAFTETYRKLEAILAASPAAPVAVEPVAPFGYWHQGATYEESDFFLHSETGHVACEKCVVLVTLPQLQQAVERAREEGRAKERAAILEARDDVEEPPWTGYECPNTFQDGVLAYVAVIEKRGPKP